MAEGRTTAKKIEFIANVGIILVVLVIGFIVVRNVLKKPPPTVAIGAKFSLANVDWRSSDKTVVLAVSTTCHYCQESAGFYRDLIAQCKQQHVRTIAVLPESVATSTPYLQGEGIVVDEVHQAALPTLQINGTPTVVLVDGSGVVKAVWVGKLPDQKEKELLAKVIS